MWRMVDRSWTFRRVDDDDQRVRYRQQPAARFDICQHFQNSNTALINPLGTEFFVAI
jgi:hypothetical protein